MKPAKVEQALVAYLATPLGMPVSTRVPEPRPAQFIRVTRAGGAQRNLAQADSRILVECWGTTDALAWDAAERSWALLNVLDHTTLIDVGRVTLADPVNYPDSLSGSPRYQYIADLVVNLKEN